MSGQEAPWRPVVGSKVRAVRDDGAVRTYIVLVTRSGTWAAVYSVDAPGVPTTNVSIGITYLAEEHARAACEVHFRASGSRWSWAQPADLS